MRRISKTILGRLYLPPADAHKGDNGRLLIIAGSKKYHGSLILCAVMAAKIADIVYVHTIRDNYVLLQKVKEKLAEFIYINASDLPRTINEVDAILLGPGLLPDQATKRLVKYILANYPDKKTVLDAGALRVLNLKWLHKNCALTPHVGEFAFLFGEEAEGISISKLSEISKNCPAIIILKGRIDYIADNGKLWSNATGNAGMTKGGTGDVLSGLLAALAAKNDLLMAACAATYMNGLAGDRLKKKFGIYYSASELIPEIRAALAKR